MQPGELCAGQREIRHLDARLAVADDGASLAWFRIAALRNPVWNFDGPAPSGCTQHYQHATSVGCHGQRLDRAIASYINCLRISQRIDAVPLGLRNAVVGDLVANHVEQVALLLCEPFALWRRWCRGILGRGAGSEIGQLRRQARGEVDRECVAIAYEVHALRIAAQDRVGFSCRRVCQSPQSVSAVVHEIDVAAELYCAVVTVSGNDCVRRVRSRGVALCQREFLGPGTIDGADAICGGLSAPTATWRDPVEIDPATVG